VTIFGDLRAGVSPAVEELLEGFDSSGPAPLTARARRVEWAAAAAFLAAAVPMAALLPALHEPSVPFALALVAAYAVASRIRFAIGYGFTVPTQIVFVPMLFLLPVGAVPLFVAAGIALSNLPDYLTHRSHPSRIVLALGDSWHSVAPALVISLGGVAEPGLSDWPVLVAALAAQLAVDFGASTLREWLGLGISPRLQPGLLGWVALVDVLLSPLGLLAALSAAGAPYTALLVLPLCGLLAIFAIERKARVAQALELSRAYRGTTLLLSDVLEADDEYTGLHSRGVVSLSVAVADELDMNSRERRNVEFGALLHDVGKIAVPKSIINKPGPLTEDEWVVVKAHTIEGQHMLDRVGGLLSDVGRIVRSSHEYWDGSGYPDGLAADEIPLESTVVSCCDAFNAITTDRPYRAARSTAEALEEVTAGSGRQFNPIVVEALTRIVQRSLVEEDAANGRRKGIHAVALPAVD
jgi:HD-GYP domain-containing protein (c-di-GMP phosphodiesterase class II)